jgi:hypothetical protein
MTPTSIETLGNDIATQIRAITPTFDRHQDFRWAYVDTVEEVPGSRPRLFHLLFAFPVPEYDGQIWSGDGYTYRTELSVFASYVGIRDRDVEPMIYDDGRQIFLRLESRLDPQIDGLLSVEYSGFNPENDESGHVWGSHELTLRFLGKNEA